MLNDLADVYNNTHTDGPSSDSAAPQSMLQPRSEIQADWICEFLFKCAVNGGGRGICRAHGLGEESPPPLQPTHI